MNEMADLMIEIKSIVERLSEIIDDGSVPKNVRTHIQKIILSLKDGNELSINVNKALNQLDELSSDVNIQSYTRTQIWNVVSTLEKLHK